jgi:subtilisin family serine protease
MVRLLAALGVLTLAFFLAGASHGMPEPPGADQVMWGLDRIDQRSGFDNRFEPGGSGHGVRIYIIDTGVKLNHADFGGRAFAGNTYIQDGRGANDCAGHGTHVAGVAGGSRYGVAKGAAVISVRIGDCSGAWSIDYLDDAVRWVTEAHRSSGVPGVLNISGAPLPGAGFQSDVRSALDAGLTITVAAGEGPAGGSGQEECSENTWSAMDPRLIVVSASTSADRTMPGANYGACVDLYAPGHEVVSAWPFPANWSQQCTSSTTTYEIDGETYCNGTSMAAPHVAGAAALYLQRFPDASPADVEWALVKAATQGIIVEPTTQTRGRLLYVRVNEFLPPPPDPHCGVVCL